MLNIHEVLALKSLALNVFGKAGLTQLTTKK